jgi:hypothetical protein
VKRGGERAGKGWKRGRYIRNDILEPRIRREKFREPSCGGGAGVFGTVKDCAICKYIESFVLHTSSSLLENPGVLLTLKVKPSLRMISR